MFHVLEPQEAGPRPVGLGRQRLLERLEILLEIPAVVPEPRVGAVDRIPEDGEDPGVGPEFVNPAICLQRVEGGRGGIPCADVLGAVTNSSRYCSSVRSLPGGG
jgi:hypothetical protein